MSQDYTDPYNLRRTVLVAVVNNQADLRRAGSEGWYRIPQRRAPRPDRRRLSGFLPDGRV